ncbi:type II secretion system protein [Pelagicoccus mobilis]|uniref:Prepilin-type N-terminal cleavage/methylation domain-containing protein n=1 Tax=Pelagicoccus mobilis TaxID=415221 RepID=A0A934RWY9_9BACT|nr:prepilin-type N-terminal cleavage/methylation domain-containing protein [Pelagicoccus mobilis]MBK1877020.1 prepilin-type N-terminal cleavage/methylation domain-containing protein [Pelagicoccus mobilis]
MKKGRRISNSRNGFTLVEIMVVVVIVGLLASIAIPGFTQSKRNSVASRTASDFKKFADQFSLYNLSTGVWPSDGYPSTIPTGMDDQLGKGTWTDITAIGGQWDWDYQAMGFTAAVSIHGHSVDNETILSIDRLIDDGNLSTGSFVRVSEDHVSYIIEE